MMCQFSKLIEICLSEAHWGLPFFSFALTPQDSINLPFHCNSHPCCLPPSYSQSAPPTVLPPLSATRMERKFSFTSFPAFVKQNCGKPMPSGCRSDGKLLKCFQQSFLAKIFCSQQDLCFRCFCCSWRDHAPYVCGWKAFNRFQSTLAMAFSLQLCELSARSTPSIFCISEQVYAGSDISFLQRSLPYPVFLWFFGDAVTNNLRLHSFKVSL